VKSGDPLPANDVTLTAAPTYQSGPLGGFYLPTGTQLSGAGHGLPGDVGLYHYTTRVDQTKAGEQTGNVNVNIGFHYVATAGSASVQPRDTDSDGIPDYVENWHGDGNYLSHTHTETDWENAETESGTPDAYNTIYDDIDLDGDGMVGRIEKVLVKNPLVSDNPLILQAADGDWPEFRKFKLPINYDFLTGIANVRLWLETGKEPPVQALLEDDMDASTVLVWNTTFDPPGQHLLQPRIYLKTLPDEAMVTRAAGPLLPFETDNALQFVSLYSTFDANGAILYAETYPGTEYSIELRDIDGNHLKTISGTVPMDSTQIDVTWDLRQEDQTLFTGDSLMAAFTVTPPSSPPQTRVRPGWRTALGYGDGPFTVGYRWGTLIDGQPSSGRGKPLDNCIQRGVVDVLLKPGQENPYRYSSVFNDYTPLAPSYYQFGGAGYIADQGRVDALLDDLARKTENVVRNFFWYGHGEPAGWIGFKPDVNIWARDVAGRLGNDYEFHATPDNFEFIKTYRDHPYRFVLIDGCDTGANAIWAEAFGIPGEEITYKQIRNHTERAQAFLGFTEPVFSQNSEIGFGWYRRTLFVFFSHWMRGNTPLQGCFDVAGDRDRLYKHLRELGDDIEEKNVMQMGRWQQDTHKTVNFKKIDRIYGYRYITRNGVSPPP
jgi:hypothetical protein